MSEIRNLSEEEIDVFTTIVVNAYPGMKISSLEKREQLKQRILRSHSEDETTAFYGLFRKGKLLGGMRLHNFTMKLLSAKTLVGGVGMVAVDLLHKKEKVGKELIAFFLQHYLEQGACMVSLYPFRPGFYEKMGFGFGMKMNQYRVKPDVLPKGDSKAHVHFIDKDDKQALRDCYSRMLDRSNGLIEKTEFELNAIFDNSNNRIAAYKQGDKILGYAVFRFQSVKDDQWLLNDIHVSEFMFETHEALSELMTFLHSQADQINRVIFNTQDEHFHRLFIDPRNGSGNIIPSVYHESHTSGVGIMYRVLDTRRAFEVLRGHNFGGQNCKLKLSIDDNFLNSSHGSTIIHFHDGKAHLDSDEDHEVEIKLKVADFSSLLIGAVDFRTLYHYGQAGISDTEYIDTVNNIFWTHQKPICTTLF